MFIVCKDSKIAYKKQGIAYFSSIHAVIIIHISKTGENGNFDSS